MSIKIKHGQLLTTAAEVAAYLKVRNAQPNGQPDLTIFILDSNGEWIYGPAYIDSIDADGTVDISSGGSRLFWQNGVLWQDAWLDGHFAVAAEKGWQLLVWSDDGSTPGP